MTQETYRLIIGICSIAITLLVAIKMFPEIRPRRRRRRDAYRIDNRIDQVHYRIDELQQQTQLDMQNLIKALIEGGIDAIKKFADEREKKE